MIAVTFDKATGVEFARCFADGQPIPHEGPWTSDDMLTLAGACIFAVSSQGPTSAKVAEHLGVPVPERHPEHAEAIEKEYVADIHAAIEFLSDLAMRAYDGDYDEHFEPVVQVLLSAGDETITPLRGFKQHPGGATFMPDSEPK